MSDSFCRGFACEDRSGRWLIFFTLSGLCALLLSGCRSSEVADVAAFSSYVTTYDADVALQNSSIAVGAPKQLYSKQVAKSDLWRMNMQHGCKFYEPWKYMGTKDGEHYLAIYPFLGFREVYRIAEDEYPIEDPFELTARSSKWRDINEFSHYGVEQPFIIEPLLFEQTEGLELIQVNAIQVDGLGGDVEDLFMQDVQILELE